MKACGPGARDEVILLMKSRQLWQEARTVCVCKRVRERGRKQSNLSHLKWCNTKTNVTFFKTIQNPNQTKTAWLMLDGKRRQDVLLWSQQPGTHNSYTNSQSLTLGLSHLPVRAEDASSMKVRKSSRPVVTTPWILPVRQDAGTSGLSG